MATAACGLRGSVATTLRDAFSVAGRIDMEHDGGCEQSAEMDQYYEFGGG
jgi:hypothetical protein